MGFAWLVTFARVPFVKFNGGLRCFIVEKSPNPSYDW